MAQADKQIEKIHAILDGDLTDQEALKRIRDVLYGPEEEEDEPDEDDEPDDEEK